MGEAKRRGSFEERRAQAEQQVVAPPLRPRQPGKSRLSALLFAALAAGAGMSFPTSKK